MNNLHEPASKRLLPDTHSFTSLAADYLVGGVDRNLAGNGGPGCVTFRSPQRKIVETVLLCGICVLAYKYAFQRIQKILPERSTALEARTGRQLALVALTIMFGIQIGFKFGSRTVIWLLQPCHMITALQIYLLAVPNHKHTNYLYRIHFGFLSGPILALLFPVTDSLSLPGEFEMYWIQHLVLPLMPFYFYSLGEPYTVDLTDKGAFTVISYVYFIFYHVLILQPIAMYSGVNVSTTLCPSPTDPFYGPNYILHAAWHQALVIAVVCTTYTYLLSKPNNNKHAVQ